MLSPSPIALLGTDVDVERNAVLFALPIGSVPPPGFDSVSCYTINAVSRGSLPVTLQLVDYGGCSIVMEWVQH